MSAMARVALRGPDAVGEKLAEMLQLELAGNVDGLIGQFVLWMKSPALAPVKPRLVMLRSAVPELVSVVA